MVTRFPEYNYVVLLDDGRWRAEIQSNSGMNDVVHFSNRNDAIRYARRMASQMLTHDKLEPEVYS